jgi:hypothetical protein
VFVSCHFASLSDNRQGPLPRRVVHVATLFFCRVSYSFHISVLF